MDFANLVQSKKNKKKKRPCGKKLFGKILKTNRATYPVSFWSIVSKVTRIRLLHGYFLNSSSGWYLLRTVTLRYFIRKVFARKKPAALLKKETPAERLLCWIFQNTAFYNTSWVTGSNMQSPSKQVSKGGSCSWFVLITSANQIAVTAAQE